VGIRDANNNVHNRINDRDDIFDIIRDNKNDRGDTPGKEITFDGGNDDDDDDDTTGGAVRA
jgi:hypothetical protein